MTIASALLLPTGESNPIAAVPPSAWRKIVTPGLVAQLTHVAQIPRVTWAFLVLREHERKAKPSNSALSRARGRG